MHIKSFLKKISEIPNSDIHTVSKQGRQASRHVYSNSLKADGASFSDKMLTKTLKNTESTLKYLNHHHPIIKAKLLKTGERSSSPPQESVRTRFREKIEERLMELMNQRKELVVTHVRSKKDNSGSLHHRSHKSCLPPKPRVQKMPDYVQNIMKPCRISQVLISNRPKSSRVEHAKSEPKIYCKQIITSRKTRISTADFSLLKTPRKSKAQLFEERKQKMIIMNKLEGWNKSKNNQEDDDDWLRQQEERL